MADLAITNTAVVAGSNAKTESKLAGVAIAAGETVYVEAATDKLKLADSDGASAEVKTCAGIALNDAAPNQPVRYIYEGDLTINAVLTKGATYFLSSTAGGICPDADVGSGENVVLLGIAKSTTVLAVKIIDPLVARD